MSPELQALLDKLQDAKNAAVELVHRLDGTQAELAAMRRERDAFRLRCERQREEFAQIADREAGAEQADWTNQNAAHGRHAAAKAIAKAIRSAELK